MQPRSVVRRIATAVFAAVSTVTVLAVDTEAAPVPGAADTPLDYVALGDSYASAPLVQPTDPSAPLCLRSLADYPHVAAKALDAQLTDVSCAGATTASLTGAQYPDTLPQERALTPGTDLVSITIGANDAGLFDEALHCVNVLPEPTGTSCAAVDTAGGVDRIGARIDAMAPRLATALDHIHTRAPHAQVFVVGYGDFFRPGGCYPVQPFWAVDADYLQGEVNHLNAVLQETAARHGAAFVDTYRPSVGHDTCAPVTDRYFEGVVPGRVAAPLHPNVAGARAIGATLTAAVTTPTGR